MAPRNTGTYAPWSGLVPEVLDKSLHGAPADKGVAVGKECHFEEYTARTTIV